MRYEHNIGWLLSIHMRCLDFMNLFYKAVQTVRDLLGGSRAACQRQARLVVCMENDLLSSLAAISPDIPASLVIQPTRRSRLPYILTRLSFIVSIIPFRQSIGHSDLPRSVKRALVVTKPKLKCLACPFPWADEDMGQFCRVNQTSIANNNFPRCYYLLGASFCEI